MKTIATLAAAFTVSLLPLTMRAQNVAGAAAAPVQHFYHLHFAVEELNAAEKVTNTRNYDETIATADGVHPVGDQQIKTGSRVPIATGSYGSNPSSANTQFQYIDLGVNVDVRDASEHGNMLGLRLKVEISSIARQTEVAGKAQLDTRVAALRLLDGKPELALRALLASR